jgi:hypothetical protein
MPHFTHDDLYDLALDGFKQNCDLMILCQGEPTSYANVIVDQGTASGQKVASVAMAPTDLIIAAGDTSGRKITSAVKASQAVTADGDGEYVCYVDTGNTKILHYYPIATARTGLTTADTVNFPAHDLEILDTVAE